MAKKEPHQLQQTKQFVRNFLRISDGREFLVFLFFLFVAFVFWYLTTMNQEYEMTYTVKLDLKNVPNKMLVTEPLPKEMKVVLKDKGDKLVEYKARGKMKVLDVDYRQHANVMGRTAIYGAELDKLLSAGLASSTQIVSTSLDTLKYYVADGRGVKLPLRFCGAVEADKQHVIEYVKFNPDSVTVYAARQVLDTMAAVYTPYVSYVELSDSVNQTIELITKEWGVRYSPAKVQLHVGVSPYVQKHVWVPVEGYMFPYGQQLKTFPSKVKVSFRVGLNDFREVTERDFKILVRHSLIHDNASGKVMLGLDEMPDNVTDVTIEPAEVDYLIEMNAPWDIDGSL